MRDWDFVRSQPVGVRHVGDGLAVPEPSEAARRVRRHLLLAGCQDLVYPYWAEKVDGETGEIKKKSEFRVAVCGREPVGEGVRVYRHGTSVGVAGVMRCGSVWACVQCAGKILRRRGEQIGALFDAVHAAGGSAVMVTFTAGHDLGDRLADLLGAVKLARRRLAQSRGYRDLVIERAALVSATEITYGSVRGWHPHFHEAWFFSHRGAVDPEQLASKLFPVWQTQCTKVGLETIEWYGKKRIGVDVRKAWDCSEYLTKFDRERSWDLSAEMTSGRLKLAHMGNLTPWQLLEDAILRGRDSPAAGLWVEYLRATKGFECVSLRGARELLREYGLPTTYDDWVDANAPGDGEVLGTVSSDAYDKVVREGGLGSLLEGARMGGLAGIAKALRG